MFQFVLVMIVVCRVLCFLLLFNFPFSQKEYAGVVLDRLIVLTGGFSFVIAERCFDCRVFFNAQINMYLS